jgi:PHD/YefM family antitoxin component YafN of YafNO toxin-antitoxin module
MGKIVTAAEFEKDAGRYREIALNEPVSITEDGEARVVMVSADEYHRLKRRDRLALRPWELSDEMIAALAQAEPSRDAEQFNHEMED